MARRRSSVRYVTRFRSRGRRVSRGISSSLKGGMLGTGLRGIGGGWLAETVADRVAPQYRMIAGTAGSYMAGGIVGVGAYLAKNALEGTLGNIFGGSAATSGGGEAI